jgi:hypothetical protein
VATALRISGVRLARHGSTSRRPRAGALLAVALAWALRGPSSPATDLAARGVVTYPRRRT